MRCPSSAVPIFIFAFGIGSLSKARWVFLSASNPSSSITSQGARGVDRVLLWSAPNNGRFARGNPAAHRHPGHRAVLFAGFRSPAGRSIVVVITEMISSRRARPTKVIYRVLAQDRPHLRAGGRQSRCSAGCYRALVSW